MEETGNGQRRSEELYTQEETQVSYSNDVKCNGSGRASDSRLREPGFESCAAVLKHWASFFTLNCSFHTLIVACVCMLPT